MEINPTKKWVKEHHPCPHFKVKCRQVLDSFDKLGQGWCVGLNPDACDLDVVNLCIGFSQSWRKGSPIKIKHHAVTPIEASDIGSCLHIAVAEVFNLNPQFRKQAGIMKRKRGKQYSG